MIKEKAGSDPESRFFFHANVLNILAPDLTCGIRFIGELLWSDFQEICFTLTHLQWLTTREMVFVDSDRRSARAVTCNLNRFARFYLSEVFWIFGRLLWFVPVFLISLAVQLENPMNSRLRPSLSDEEKYPSHLPTSRPAVHKFSERCITATADPLLLNWWVIVTLEVGALPPHCASMRLSRTRLSSDLILHSLSALSKTFCSTSALYCLTVLQCVSAN